MKKATSPSSNKRIFFWQPLLGLTFLAVVVYAWGIGHDLPYIVQPDEHIFYAAPAVRMAATGTLHPQYLEHPASTVRYPLALLYRLWFFFAHRGRLLHPDPNIALAYGQNPGPFLLLGRLLSAVYAISSIPLLWLLGNRLFGRRSATIAGWFMIWTYWLLIYVQMIRDDSACIFYGLLFVLAALRAYRKPSAGNHAIAGATLGLAISTKYYMALFAILLVSIDLLLLIRPPLPRRKLWLAFAVAPLLAALTFVCTTPFFLLDWAKARQDLLGEIRPRHLGADGLSPLGNIWWYLSAGLPRAMGWPGAILAYVGIAWILKQGHTTAKLLVVLVTTFLAGISLSALHWPRWSFPVLPYLCLFAAQPLDEFLRWLQRRATPLRLRRLVTLALILACSGYDIYECVLSDIRQSHPSTMVIAREWLLDNLPHDATIVYEFYTAPLERTTFRAQRVFAFPEKSLEAYRELGADYIVIGSAIQDRFLREPDRYAAQIRAYERLEKEALLLQEIEPAFTQAGPTIRIYALDRSKP